MQPLTGEQVVRARERARVNADTVVRARAPLRISFAGGGTDFPHYYNEHGGAVLSTTINRYSHVSLYPRDDAEARIRSLDIGSSVRYAIDEEPVYNGVLDLAKAAVRRMGLDVGFELDVHSEAPPGSGLGGSSAMTGAILGALCEYTGVVLDRYEMADLNWIVERVELDISGGRQDQYATTFGGFNLIEFHEDRTVVTPLRIPRDVRNDLETHLLLCYTGKARPSLGLIDDQIRFYEERRLTTLEGMQRLHQLVYEMKDALVAGDLRSFAELLHEAHENKKRMNPHVTDAAIEAMYARAREHGAIGGKLCGAGGGGYLLLFVEAARAYEVRNALEEVGGQFSDFSLEDHGLEVWRSQCP